MTQSKTPCRPKTGTPEWRKEASRKALERRRKNYDKLERRVQVLWGGMKQRCRHTPNFSPQYDHVELKITKEDFYSWALKDEGLLKLHNAWIESGHKMHLVPTVDRIDSRGHYERSNMRFITHIDNTLAEHGITKSRGPGECDFPGCSLKRDQARRSTATGEMIYHKSCWKHRTVNRREEYE